MTQQTFTRQAWASNPEALQDIINGVTCPELMDYDMSHTGWVKLGIATITVDLSEESELKLEAVRQLNTAIKKVRADTEVKVAHLEQMIQNLLAIEYTAPEPVAVQTVDFTDIDDIPF